jgi:hypothetical protein
MAFATPLKGHTMNPRKAGSAPDPRTRARGGTVIDVIAVLVILGLIAYGVYWVMKTTGKAGQQYATAMINTHEKAMTLTCQMNLQSIHQTLLTYAVSNESFPGSQQELVSFAGYGSKLFHCPDPNGSEYTYIPGHRPDTSAPAVLVYESKPVHNGKCNALLSDGQIVLLSPEELQQALDAMKAHQR